VAALVLTGAVVAVVVLLRDRLRPAALACAVAGITLLGLGLQSQASWKWQIDLAQAWRQPFPAQLSWLDDAARGQPVARLTLTANHPRFPTVEFFNKDIRQVYVPGTPLSGRPIFGKTCVWSLSRTGEARFARACGTPARLFYLDDPAGIVTFYGQRVIRRTRGAGRLVAVSGTPKVEAILGIPCEDPTLVVLKSGRSLSFSPRICRGQVAASFWLKERATLRLRFRGGQFTHKVRTSDERIVTLPPHKVTTVDMPVRKGPSKVLVPFDDTEDTGAPDLISADLVRGAQTKSLM
jgi:hypothetical protein